MENALRKWLADPPGRTIIAAVGNEMRSDAAAAIYVMRRLTELRKRGMLDPGISLVMCGERIDVFLDRFMEENPARLLILDAADLGGEPGEVRMIMGDDTMKTSFTSGTPYLDDFLDKLKAVRPGLRVAIVGIQPVSRELGAEMAYEVTVAADETYEMLGRLLFRS